MKTQQNSGIQSKLVHIIKTKFQWIISKSYRIDLKQHSSLDEDSPTLIATSFYNCTSKDRFMAAISPPKNSFDPLVTTSRLLKLVVEDCCYIQKSAIILTKNLKVSLDLNNFVN